MQKKKRIEIDAHINSFNALCNLIERALIKLMRTLVQLMGAFSSIALFNSINVRINFAEIVPALINSELSVNDLMITRIFNSFVDINRFLLKLSLASPKINLYIFTLFMLINMTAAYLDLLAREKNFQ
jgi:hypothetical protein